MDCILVPAAMFSAVSYSSSTSASSATVPRMPLIWPLSLASSSDMVAELKPFFTMSAASASAFRRLYSLVRDFTASSRSWASLMSFFSLFLVAWNSS